MSSCWAVKYADVEACRTSEQIKTIINNVSAEQLKKKRINLAIKVVAGGLFLGGIIAGSIFLGRVSPIGAAALVGGVSLSVSAMKILSYAFKIPPFNRHASLPTEKAQSNSEQKKEDFFRLLVKGFTALKTNNNDENTFVKEFQDYRKYVKNNLTTRKEFKAIKAEFVEKLKIDYKTVKKSKPAVSS